jgi:hypothetical protein
LPFLDYLDICSDATILILRRFLYGKQDYKNDKLQKRDGHIKTTFKNGDSYDGNYLDGEIHGKGVYT